MLNMEIINEMFPESESTCDSQIFAHKNGLTYDISKTHKDIRVSDTKGNTVCVYHDGSRIRTRIWAERVSKKLDKASDQIIEKFDRIYH